MRGYGQFCPMSRAAEILCERWTLLIVRELLAGSSRFNDIHRGVPLISRTVLSERLAGLVEHGVIEHGADGLYRPTEAGRALQPIVVGLAEWGDQYIRDEIRTEHLDAGLLMWDIRRNLRAEIMPAGHHVICIRFTDAPGGKELWWLVISDEGVELCLTDPGHEPDLWLTTDLRTLTEIWVGARDMRRSLRRGYLQACGDRHLERTLPGWLPGSMLNQMKRQTAKIATTT